MHIFKAKKIDIAIPVAVYLILGHMSAPYAIAQTIKTSDGVDVSYINLRDDMKSYQIIYKEHAREYDDYFKVVRERIVRRLKHNYRDHYCNGDVDIFFLLYSNGSLGRIDVDLGKSTTDKGLIDIALFSLRQASPFAPFPKELDVASLPFSLTISFKEKSD